MNVVDPDISVVLPIALDHQEYLGDSREEIGGEKAGILRPGQSAVIGDPDPPSFFGSGRTVCVSGGALW